MRRIFLFLLCCISASAVLAQSYKLVINKTDGQTLELNTSDVKEIQVVAADGTRSLTVSDLTNSGCIDRARAEQKIVPTIVLKKEGEGVVSVELLDYYAQCAVTGFEVVAAVGNDGKMVDVDLTEIAVAEADCTCPYNISFKLLGLTANTFHLSCWWFSGEVSFEGTDEVRLERDMKLVTVDGMTYRLFTSTHQAVFWRANREQGGELAIPSTVTIDGEDYTVSALGELACAYLKSMTRVVLPATLSGIFSDSGKARFKVNPFVGCTALTDIVVEEGNNWFKVVDGVLMSRDGTVLYSYPGGNQQPSYTIPEGVTQLAQSAFQGCTQLEQLTMPTTLHAIGNFAFYGAAGLRTLDFPENVTRLGSYLFAECKLDRIIFRSFIDDPSGMWSAFLYMDKSTVLYVQPSAVEVFKQVYGGTVLSLEELK